MNIYKSLNTKNKMKKNPFGKSKDIFKLGAPYSKPKKKLSKYGDYDLDGTLNSKDCNPYDPSKDGLFGRLANIVTFGKFGQSKEDYRAEKAEKKSQSYSNQLQSIKQKMEKPQFSGQLRQQFRDAGKMRFPEKKVDISDIPMPEKKRNEFAFVERGGKKYLTNVPKEDNIPEVEWKGKGKEKAVKYYTEAYYKLQQDKLKADKAKKWAATKEKAKAWRKKWVPYADELVEQVKHPLSRKIKQTRMVAVTDAKGKAVIDPNTGQPLMEQKTSYIRKQVFSDRRSKYGGRTYQGLGLSFHAAKTRLRKDRKTAYGKTQGNVGRPKGTYKPRFIPGVGWRTNITAQQYYKILRKIKAQQEGQAMATDLTQTQVLARRGIPPREAQQIVNQAQLQRAYSAVPVSQAPEPQGIPQNIQFQAQMAQIQQLEPWARRAAILRLQRLQQTAQPLPPRVVQRPEVSLMTGRPVFKQEIQTRERWLM
jgi:hypothetical protein